MANMGRGEDEHYELEASDEFHTYDATEQGGGGRTLLILIGILLILGLFGGVLYLAYQQGMQEGIRTAPPLIEADNSPLKVIPDEPGGMEIPNTDKLIYDRMNGRAPAEGGVEQLLPTAEEPLAMEPAPLPVTPATPRPRDTVEVLPPPISIRPDPETRVPAVNTAGDKNAPSPQVPVPAVRDRPAPAVLPVTQPRPVVPARPATTGNFVVQIAAFRDQAQADAEFVKLKAAHPDILGGLSSDIQRADLGDKGIYFRLRVGPFGTNTDAGATCDRLKGRGLDCIVRPR